MGARRLSGCGPAQVYLPLFLYSFLAFTGSWWESPMGSTVICMRPCISHVSGSPYRTKPGAVRKSCAYSEGRESALRSGSPDPLALARQVCAAAGTAVSRDGARCECAAGSYNASAAGALLCVGAGWSRPLLLSFFACPLLSSRGTTALGAV